MKYLLVFFIFLFTHTAFAQHLLIGPKAGGQLSRAYFNDQEYSARYPSGFALAYHAGIVSNIKVSELFSLHTEMLYNQTAKKIRGRSYDLQNTERYQLLTAPLLLRASFRQGFCQYYVNAGPNVSYWVNGFGSIRTDELDDHGMHSTNYQLRFKDGISTLDRYFAPHPNRLLLGLDIGAGVMLPIQKQFLMLDVRYTWGHTHMGSSSQNYMNFLYYESNLQHANHLLSFSVAYLFEFDFFTLSTKGKSKSRGEK